MVIGTVTMQHCFMQKPAVHLTLKQTTEPPKHLTHHTPPSSNPQSLTLTFPFIGNLQCHIFTLGCSECTWVTVCPSVGSTQGIISCLPTVTKPPTLSKPPVTYPYTPPHRQPAVSHLHTGLLWMYIIIIIIHNLLSAIKRNSRRFTNIKNIKNCTQNHIAKNIIDRSKTDQGYNHACQCIVMGGTKEHKTTKMARSGRTKQRVPCTMKPPQYK